MMLIVVVQMFSKTEHSKDYIPTAGKTVYNISLLLDLELVEGKLIDLPPIDIETFPLVRHLASPQEKTDTIISGQRRGVEETQTLLTPRG